MKSSMTMTPSFDQRVFNKLLEFLEPLPIESSVVQVILAEKHVEGSFTFRGHQVNSGGVNLLLAAAIRAATVVFTYRIW